MRVCDAVYTVDANVIVRYLLRDNETLYRKSARMMRALLKRQIRMFCDPVTL